MQVRLDEARLNAKTHLPPPFRIRPLGQLYFRALNFHGIISQSLILIIFQPPVLGRSKLLHLYFLSPPTPILLSSINTYSLKRCKVVILNLFYSSLLYQSYITFLLSFLLIYDYFITHVTLVSNFGLGKKVGFMNLPCFGPKFIPQIILHPKFVIISSTYRFLRGEPRQLICLEMHSSKILYHLIAYFSKQ